MSLLSYEHQFANLKLNSRGGGEKSPHKVAMLLAVVDLMGINGDRPRLIPSLECLFLMGLI